MSTKKKTPAASLKRCKHGLGLPIHIKYQLILINIRYYMVLVLNKLLYINYIEFPSRIRNFPSRHISLLLLMLLLVPWAWGVAQLLSYWLRFWPAQQLWGFSPSFKLTTPVLHIGSGRPAAERLLAAAAEKSKIYPSRKIVINRQCNTRVPGRSTVY